MVDDSPVARAPLSPADAAALTANGLLATGPGSVVASQAMTAASANLQAQQTALAVRHSLDDEVQADKFGVISTALDYWLKQEGKLGRPLAGSSLRTNCALLAGAGLMLHGLIKSKGQPAHALSDTLWGALGDFALGGGAGWVLGSVAESFSVDASASVRVPLELPREIHVNLRAALPDASRERRDAWLRSWRELAEAENDRRGARSPLALPATALTSLASTLGVMRR